MTKRIFDNPRHPQYGPVRRMWVILMQLGIDADRYVHEGEPSWDKYLAGRVAYGVEEPAAQRDLLSALLYRMENER